MTFMLIYCDNKPVISIVHYLVFRDRTNHIKVDKHFIKEKNDKNDVGVIYILYLPSTNQIVDVLTKKDYQKLQFIKLNDKLAKKVIFKPT